MGLFDLAFLRVGRAETRWGENDKSSWHYETRSVRDYLKSVQKIGILVVAAPRAMTLSRSSFVYDISFGVEDL